MSPYKEKIICQGCKGEYVAYKHEHRKFCSNKCRLDALHTQENLEKMWQKTRGKEPWNKGKTGIYSDETRKLMATGRKGKTPWNKGLSYGPEIKEKISKSCKGIKKPKIAEIMTGAIKEKAHNWQGGKTKESKRIRNSRDFANWRTSVFKRDNYTCQDCGATGGLYLEAHHIRSFAHHEELRFDINNGLTLCKECHKKTDNYAHKTCIKKQEAR
jgi:hypothetical protein